MPAAPGARKGVPGGQPGGARPVNEKHIQEALQRGARQDEAAQCDLPGVFHRSTSRQPVADRRAGAGLPIPWITRAAAVVGAPDYDAAPAKPLEVYWWA